MRKLVLSVAAGAALASASVAANATTYIGYTQGCFGASCTPVPLVSDLGLTFTNGVFNQADSNGFLSIGSGTPPTDTLGLLSLTALPASYTGTLFTLLVSFTQPGSTSGTYSATLLGSVSGSNTGGVHFDFNNNPLLFTYNGGMFTLTVNDVDVSGDGAAVPITGFIQAVPEPGTWALMLLGFSGIGLMMRRRRPALTQIA